MLPRWMGHAAARCDSLVLPTAARSIAAGSLANDLRPLEDQRNQQPQQQQQRRYFVKQRRQGGGKSGGYRQSTRERQRQEALRKKKEIISRHKARFKRSEKILEEHRRNNPTPYDDEPPVPPAMLCPTASPFVYVAKSAALEMLSVYQRHESEQLFENQNQDEQQNQTIDYKSLFKGISRGPPTSFARSAFQNYKPHVRKKIPNELNEVAFLGRSNVGKSSLANAIMKDDSLCMTSKPPGRTQKEYYYGMVPDAELKGIKGDKSRIPTPLGWIVDLPGYGFARAPDAAVEGWQASTQDWLLERIEAGTFQRLYLLIDARRGAMDMDRAIMGWMDEALIPYTVVITKIDRVRLPEVIKIVNELCLRYTSVSSIERDRDENEEVDEYDISNMQSPVIHLTSSKENMGLYELMHSIDADFKNEPGDPMDEEWT